MNMGMSEEYYKYVMEGRLKTDNGINPNCPKEKYETMVHE